MKRLLQLTAAILTISISLLGVPSASSAGNNCGSWKAGEHSTHSYSLSSFFVKGDKAGATSQSYIWVAPGKNANNYGVCDADHTWINGDWAKISFGHHWCAKYSSGQSICTWSVS